MFPSEVIKVDRFVWDHCSLAFHGTAKGSLRVLLLFLSLLASLVTKSILKGIELGLQGVEVPAFFFLSCLCLHQSLELFKLLCLLFELDLFLKIHLALQTDHVLLDSVVPLTVFVSLLVACLDFAFELDDLYLLRAKFIS